MKIKAELIGIARKTRSRAPWKALTALRSQKELGVNGDYRGKLRRRQVTILAKEDWQAACREIDQGDIHGPNAAQTCMSAASCYRGSKAANFQSVV